MAFLDISIFIKFLVILFPVFTNIEYHCQILFTCQVSSELDHPNGNQRGRRMCPHPSLPGHTNLQKGNRQVKSDQTFSKKFRCFYTSNENENVRWPLEIFKKISDYRKKCSENRNKLTFETVFSFFNLSLLAEEGGF